MSDVHVVVKELPESLQLCLREVGFAKRDIRVQARESITPNSAPSGQGTRSFFAMVNLSTGQRQVSQGSWGGTNMFTQTIADDMRKSVALQPGMAAVFGHTGHHNNAWIVLHPSNMAAMLPAPPDVTPRQRWILGCFKELTSAGRKDEFSRVDAPPSAEELSALATAGYLKINKAGATSITTAGKNVAGRHYDYHAPA